jgi:NhaP-type Na+/H+ and K+/H+ antiporter
VTLQLAFPNFGDPYSAIAYIVSLASLFAQAWVLAHFHSKLKMILDYQDNT